MTRPHTRREHIEAAVSDTVSRFLYYDRKEDEDLPRGSIGEAVAAGEITVDELVALFARELRVGLAPPTTVTSPAPTSRTCNRHNDCDSADAKARAAGRLGADHCHDECCEDCFGS